MTKIHNFQGKKSIKLIHWAAMGENAQGHPIGLCTLKHHTDCMPQANYAARGICNRKLKCWICWKKEVWFGCPQTLNWPGTANSKASVLKCEMRLRPLTGRNAAWLLLTTPSPREGKLQPKTTHFQPIGGANHQGGLFVHASSVADVAGRCTGYIRWTNWHRSLWDSPFC